MVLLDEMLAACAREASNKSLELIFSSHLFYQNRQEKFISRLAGKLHQAHQKVRRWVTSGIRRSESRCCFHPRASKEAEGPSDVPPVSLLRLSRQPLTLLPLGSFLRCRRAAKEGGQHHALHHGAGCQVCGAPPPQRHAPAGHHRGLPGEEGRVPGQQGESSRGGPLQESSSSAGRCVLRSSRSWSSPSAG